MYPSLWRMNEPDGDKPQEPSCLEGCVGCLVLSLVLIIGPICYWNYWTGEIKRKEEQKRKFQNFNRQLENINPHMPEEWRKEQERRREEWRRLEEEFRKSKNLP